MSDNLPDGAAHIEIEISPTFIAFAVNKYLTANHPPDAYGEPLLQASFSINNAEFLEPTDYPVRNAVLLRMNIGAYLHDLHYYVAEPILTLRVEIQTKYKLYIFQHSLEFPDTWNDEKRVKVQNQVNDLLNSLAAIPDLPKSFEAVGGASDFLINEYMVKRTPMGHLLLGIVLEGAGTPVDVEAFHWENVGLCSNPNHHWGFSVYHGVLRKLLSIILAGRLGPELVLDSPGYGDITFSDYSIRIDGSGTYTEEFWAGPGLTREECNIRFDYSANIQVDRYPENRFISFRIGPIDASPNPVDISNCIARQMASRPFPELIGLAVLTFFLGSEPILILAIPLAIWMLALVAIEIFGKTAEPPPPISSAGVQDLGNNRYRVSFADSVPNIGGLVWPLRPQELDWGLTESPQRRDCVSVIGDLGELPEDIELDRLHPAYQFTSELSDGIGGYFEAYLPLVSGLAFGYTDAHPVEVINAMDTGLLAICGWEIIEIDDSDFTQAFTLGSSYPTGTTVVVAAHARALVNIQFGPNVYDKNAKSWRPNTSFIAGTEFRAYVKISYLKSNAQIGGYILERKEALLLLTGTVRDPLPTWEGIPGERDWQLYERLTKNYLVDHVNAFKVHDYFKDIPVHTDDWRVLEVFSDDPGLLEVKLMDDKGKVVAFSQRNMRISFPVDAEVLYGLLNIAERGIETNCITVGLEQYAHRYQLSFKKPISKIALSRNVLAVAIGQSIFFYDMGSTEEPRLISTYKSGGAIFGLFQAHNLQDTAFIVMTSGRLAIVVVTAHEAKNLKVSQQAVLPWIYGGVLAAHLLQKDLFLMVTTNSVQTIKVTLNGMRVISTRRINEVQNLTIGDRCIVTVSRSGLLVIFWSATGRLTIKRVRTSPVESVEFRDGYLYVHKKSSGTEVFSLQDVTHLKRVAQYRDQHFTKNWLISGKCAFRLSENRTSIDCYQRIRIPLRGTQSRQSTF